MRELSSDKERSLWFLVGDNPMNATDKLIASLVASYAKTDETGITVSVKKATRKVVRETKAVTVPVVSVAMSTIVVNPLPPTEFLSALDKEEKKEGLVVATNRDPMKRLELCKAFVAWLKVNESNRVETIDLNAAPGIALEQCRMCCKRILHPEFSQEIVPRIVLSSFTPGSASLFGSADKARAALTSHLIAARKDSLDYQGESELRLELAREEQDQDVKAILLEESALFIAKAAFENERETAIEQALDGSDSEMVSYYSALTVEKPSMVSEVIACNLGSFGLEGTEEGIARALDALANEEASLSQAQDSIAWKARCREALRIEALSK